MTQKQVLERIRTEVNIATGDDGHTGEKVLDIFVMLCKMTEKEYKIAIDWIKKPTITSSQADSFLKSLKAKQNGTSKKSTSLNKLVENTGGANAK